MRQNKLTQIRRDRSRCRRNIEKLIDVAVGKGNVTEEQRLRKWLSSLEDRWSLDFNSTTAASMKRSCHGPYFVRQ